jgi:hypothetical protein
VPVGVKLDSIAGDSLTFDSLGSTYQLS